MTKPVASNLSCFNARHISVVRLDNKIFIEVISQTKVLVNRANVRVQNIYAMQINKLWYQNTVD